MVDQLKHPGAPEQVAKATTRSMLSTVGVIGLGTIIAILSCFGPAIKLLLSAYILAQL